MPALITHSYMADSALEDIDNNGLLIIGVKPNNIRNYAIYSDCVMVNSKLWKANHECYVLDYVSYLIQYIIDNNLCENEGIISFIYGHVMHVLCDQIYHPYIYSLCCGEMSFGVRSDHFMYEAMLDAYVVNEMIGESIIDFDVDGYCFNGDGIDFDLKVMIDSSYDTIYKTKNVSKLINYSSILFRIGEKLFRYDKTGSKKKILDFLGYKFMSHNLSFNDYKKIGNDFNNRWVNVFDKNNKDENSSVIDMFEKYRSRVLQVISEINKCIYDKRIVTDNFKRCFGDISLETGIDCDYSRRLVK